jgi:hypothetical protein
MNLKGQTNIWLLRHRIFIYRLKPFMANERNLKDGRERDITGNNAERKSSVPNDLPDNPRDAKELEAEK